MYMLNCFDLGSRFILFIILISVLYRLFITQFIGYIITNNLLTSLQ